MLEVLQSSEGRPLAQALGGEAGESLVANVAIRTPQWSPRGMRRGKRDHAHAIRIHDTTTPTGSLAASDNTPSKALQISVLSSEYGDFGSRPWKNKSHSTISAALSPATVMGASGIVNATVWLHFNVSCRAPPECRAKNRAGEWLLFIP